MQMLWNLRVEGVSPRRKDWMLHERRLRMTTTGHLGIYIHAIFASFTASCMSITISSMIWFSKTIILTAGCIAMAG
jgi:hypothetical protein